MFRSVALMIFTLIPTPTFAAGNIASDEASRTSCPTLPVPKGQRRPSLELWNGLNRDKSAGKVKMRKFLVEKVHRVLRIMSDRATFRLHSSAGSGSIYYFDFG